MTPVQAYEALSAAADAVTGVKGYGVDETVQPPAVVVYPPELLPETLCSGLTTANFDVYLVVKANEVRPWSTLLGLVGATVEAIEGATPAVVIDAEPGTFTGSGTSGQLPAYRLSVQFPL